jgi:hypothetical protein
VQAVEHSRDGQRITLLAVLAGWTEKAYKRGRMVTMTLEGSKGSVEGVMWDEDRARLPAVPVTGDLVIVSAQVRVRQVEVERLDEEGETVIDSFERRDVTVKTVLQVPVQDPSRMVLAPMGELVVPEPAQGSLALDEAPEPVVQLALGTGGPDEQDAPPADPDFEPAPEHDRAEADATIHLAPVRALSVVAAPPGPEVVRVDGLILGAGNPVVRQAIRDFGVPAGFCEPAGGAWSLTTGTGQHLVVLTGAREVPGAAHLPGKAVAGWTALSLPQTAAA